MPGKLSPGLMMFCEGPGNRLVFTMWPDAALGSTPVGTGKFTGSLP